MWPDAGAAHTPLSGIYKKSYSDREAETLEACASFLFGRDLAQTMADGYFAHLHPETRHPLPPEARFRWVGWDYLLEEPLPLRVNEIEDVYYDERAKAGLKIP
jgi:hypothetical protein